ncbi:lipopolysaccharide biosynthesis protein [Amycolatopsis orientalis]|uniref:lipopolysaccharide biosynthesis protein n=1 Tax=Amycolatopsis orientalis TaxID=31958 RepID=UPI00039E1C9D|nr:hypothetical protein [Amycolatopsis orientalis]
MTTGSTAAARRARRDSAQTMIRDGVSLVAGALLTSAVGVAAWIVAARLLPQEQVGQASAFVSGFLLVAGLGDLGLGAALLRWVPRAGRLRTALIARCYALVLAGSLAAACVVLVLPTGDEITESLPRFSTAAFLFASVAWAMFQFQDAVLISLGRARWMPYENAAIGVARVGVLALAGPAFGAAGILLSWIAPALAGVAVVSVLVCRVLTRERPPDTAEPVLPDRREVLRLLVPTYPAKVTSSLLTDLVPLLVIGRFGPAPGAVFFLVWMAGNTVDYAAISFAQSVIVRIAHEPHRTRELFALGGRRLAAVFVPALVLAVLIAHPLLSVFGGDYASQGTWLLRLVLLGCLPRLVVTLVAAAGIAHGRGRLVAMLEGSSALGVLAVVAVVPVSHLALTGLGFVVVQSVVAAAAVVALWRWVRSAKTEGGTA